VPKVAWLSAAHAATHRSRRGGVQPPTGRGRAGEITGRSRSPACSGLPLPGGPERRASPDWVVGAGALCGGTTTHAGACPRSPKRSPKSRRSLCSGLQAVDPDGDIFIRMQDGSRRVYSATNLRLPPSSTAASTAAASAAAPAAAPAPTALAPAVASVAVLPKPVAPAAALLHAPDAPATPATPAALPPPGAAPEDLWVAGAAALRCGLQAEPSTASVALARRLESFIGGGAEVGMEEKCSSSSAQVGAEGGARCAEGGSTEDLAPADPGTAAVVAAVATALRRHREGGSKYPV